MHKIPPQRSFSPASLDSHGPLTRLELPICLFCNRIRSPAVLGLFSTVSWLGNGTFWALLGLAVLAVEGSAARGVIFHLSIALVLALVTHRLLKTRTARRRPFEFGSGFHLSVPPLDQYSFPSGHTLHAVAFTLVLYADLRAFFWIVLPFTVLVAMSRVILGLHYPTDVLAGAALGSLIALTAVQL